MHPLSAQDSLLQWLAPKGGTDYTASEVFPGL